MRRSCEHRSVGRHDCAGCLEARQRRDARRCRSGSPPASERLDDGRPAARRPTRHEGDRGSRRSRHACRARPRPRAVAWSGHGPRDVVGARVEHRSRLGPARRPSASRRWRHASAMVHLASRPEPTQVGPMRAACGLAVRRDAPMAARQLRQLRAAWSAARPRAAPRRSGARRAVGRTSTSSDWLAEVRALVIRRERGTACRWHVRRSSPSEQPERRRARARRGRGPAGSASPSASPVDAPATVQRSPGQRRHRAPRAGRTAGSLIEEAGLGGRRRAGRPRAHAAATPSDSGRRSVAAGRRRGEHRRPWSVRTRPTAARTDPVQPTAQRRSRP